jgi:putative PEP-CTERM system histidine kinase
MELIATSGYLICALAFLALTFILRSSWQGKIQGALIIFTCIATMVWSVISARSFYFSSFDWLFYLGELFRDAFWVAFLLVLISLRAEQEGGKTIARIIGSGTIAIFMVMLLFIGFSAENYSFVLSQAFQIKTICLLLLSITGLISIEQLFRNTPIEQRWAIKYFCLGVGGLFAYDFYLYSDTLLFGRIDTDFLAARGYINALIVPLIVISAARNPDWTLPVHVSRRFVFHSTTLIGAGAYLIAMAAGGYYIKVYGGDWGAIAQTIFLFGAIVLLAILMFSGNVRAKIKVFLAQNFFNYKYDYRQEWLRLIGSMSEEHSGEQIRINAIKAIANIVESPAGVLWFKDRNGVFRQSASWNMDVQQEWEPGSSNFVRFMQSKEWVIDILEYNDIQELYENLELPAWFKQLHNAWLIVPLMHQSELWGFAVLALPRVKQNINWEDRELLLTAGRQIASYIALLQANDELYEAQQFEAFNRLSAYVVHDLKNIVAQLSLVVANAVKHKHNPAFMDDAITTVNNAAQKMTKLLAQLRKGRMVVAGKREEVNLKYVLQEALNKRRMDNPVPQLDVNSSGEDIVIIADKDQLISVLEHLIQNAQEATDNDGCVKINCSVFDSEVTISIEDNGCGMSKEFVQEKLFRPFQTTKGNAGMGIGVYESREFVTSMGGTLTAVSELHKGTTFTIKLPTVEDSFTTSQKNARVGSISQ